jgi:hypothetical protein
MPDEFTRTWTGRAKRYEWEESGDELFDRLDRLRDNFDVNPGRRLNSGELEGLLRNDLEGECDRLTGEHESFLSVDYHGRLGEASAGCIVFER